MLTGLDPPAHGVRDNGIFSLADSIETVPEALPTQIRAAAFVGAFPLHSRFNLSQGFDHYDDEFARGDRRRPPERKAETVFALAAEWLLGGGAGERPFAWIHVFDPHYPYQPPFPWTEVARSLAGGGSYEGEVSYVDTELGKFLRQIGGTETTRDCTVIVTADHGESLGAHREITHSIFIYDSTQRVPLVVAGPGIAPRLETAQRALKDVAPTILALYGVEPSAELEGASLLGRSTTEEVYLESKEPEILRGWSPLHGIRTTEWKYIRAPRPELYDLVADPGERTNLSGQRPEIESRLAASVEEVLAASLPTIVTAMDDETAERLRSLGYIASIDPGTEADLSKDPKEMIESALWLFHGAQAYLEGRLLDAEKNLRRSIQLDPLGKEAHSYLSGTLLSLGRFDAAIEYGKRALELAPNLNEASIHATIGEAYLQKNRAEEAREQFKLALEIQPGNPEYRELLQLAEDRIR
jgi:tetratricopeptide (TPR) repeat protein